MENASKALLIAAAVLIVIMLISGGVLLLNAGKEPEKQASEVGDKISSTTKGVVQDIQIGLNKGETGSQVGPIVEKKQYLGMENKKEDSGIGCYAYLDNKYVVIYADLAFESSKYNAEDKEKLKKYYINGTYDPDTKGKGWQEKPLVVVDEEINKTEGRTIDRFYVMDLTDFTYENNKWFTWDKDKIFSEKTYETSSGFGTGRANTETLINYWNKNEKTSNKDIWNNLSKKSNWFVPSKEEWIMFKLNLNINDENYVDLGFDLAYWSSSKSDETNLFNEKIRYAWGENFYQDITTLIVDQGYCVRLSTTF